MMYLNFLLGFFAIECLIMGAQGQVQGLGDLSGEDIVAVMGTMSDKCPPTSSDGMTWAPLPKGQACGSTPTCGFPNQWCAFKLSADQTPDMTSLACKPVTDTCKQAFNELFGGSTGAAGATTGAVGATTPAAGATSPAQGTSGGMDTTTSSVMATMETTTSSQGMPTDTTTSSAVAGETTTTSAGASAPPTQPAGAGSSPSGGMDGGGTEQPGQCCDYHEFCCFWAATGECDKNKKFMMSICKKSCGTCGCKGDSCQAKVDPSCSSPDVPPGTACPCKSGHSVDKDWSPKCGSWASKGNCDSNASYMKAMCKKSCKVCQ